MMMEPGAQVSEQDFEGYQELEGEPMRVFLWRCHCADELGFDPGAACAIAEGDEDLHELAALIERGCPPQTALRILAPLT